MCYRVAVIIKFLSSKYSSNIANTLKQHEIFISVIRQGIDFREMGMPHSKFQLGNECDLKNGLKNYLPQAAMYYII